MCVCVCLSLSVCVSVVDVYSYVCFRACDFVCAPPPTPDPLLSFVFLSVRGRGERVTEGPVGKRGGNAWAALQCGKLSSTALL